MLKRSLKKHFGFENFRPNQEEIIDSILAGKDTVAIMPTGGGKSICFQLPALVLDGLTIVVSPLIALMKDQVDSLRANGIKAAFLNSTLDNAAMQGLMAQIAAKELKLLYIAPESFEYIENILKTEKISLIAVDEAHCISSWGHDFRPAYTQLGFLKKQLPDTPIMALTATADKATRTDIATQLNLIEPNIFISSFNRPNLYLEVKPGQDRIKHIQSFITERPNTSGIIYCLSRKSTEDLAQKLTKSGIKAEAYHAGLSADKRSDVQEKFINDDVPIICATIAFGMGIDKSNVRWVIHYNLPKNIEGYYQEIGRAGRDGVESDTLLFYSYSDVIQLRKFAESSSNEEFQLAKLERMQQFAESLNCRRKALLSYFGEGLPKDCGNCDNCRKPPKLFDGTIIAQKALSAVFRLQQAEPMNHLIDFLRGSSNAYIQSRGYNALKTYGVGADLSWKDWRHYIVQLLNQGYCEIAFHDGNKILLGSLANNVLYEKQKVVLANIVDTLPFEKVKKEKKSKKTATKGDESLFEVLRQLRMSIAKSEKVPPYIIFNDATLKEMVVEKPTYDEAFLAIDGVGQAKLDKYGIAFMDAILQYTNAKQNKKSNTYLETWELYQKGKTVEEIAAERELGVTTVYSHISKLFLDGKPIDLHSYLKGGNLTKIKKAKMDLKNPEGLKPYFEFFEGEMAYEQIRIALTILEKEQMENS
jgi:ATP-dependent DNA helicase RecQ